MAFNYSNSPLRDKSRSFPKAEGFNPQGCSILLNAFNPRDGLHPAAPARAFRGVLQGNAQLGQAAGMPGGGGWVDERLATAPALAKTGNKAVSRHGPRFCNRRGNNREVAPLPPVTVAPARVTILTKAEGETQWEKRAVRMSRSLSRTRSRKGRAGRLLLESL